MKVLDAWAYERAVRLAFIRDGKPVENAYVESFNGRFGDECLNEHWFVTMQHARSVIEAWRIEYNTGNFMRELEKLIAGAFPRKRGRPPFLCAVDLNESAEDDGSAYLNWIYPLGLSQGPR